MINLKHGATPRLIATVLVALLGSVGIITISESPAGATTVVTPLSQGDFSGATSSDAWINPSGSNTACLSAGTNTTATPIPGCALSTPDTAGNGVLRLTGNGGGLVGTTFNQVALPTSEGLDLTFDTYQYDGSGADGISFSLAATNPSNPSPPTSSGPSGGDLGYSTTGSTPGMTDGYLGIGLDVFGNYANSTFGGSTCTLPSGLVSGDKYPESITTRGPGNATTGYCILASTATATHSPSGTNLPNSKLLDNKSATTRTGNAVPVEIAINPSSSATVAETSGLTVPANSWFIAYQPVGIATWSSTYSLSGTLPTTSNNTELANTTVFPSSWINPTTGIPYDLTFGWAASTGGENEIHEISTLAASSLNGTVPVLSVTNTDDESGAFIAGNQASYTLTPTVSANDVSGDEGSESDAITLTDAFPSGVTPGQPTSTDPNWLCAAPSGQTISCTYTPTGAIAPGTTLTPVTVPVTISASTTTSIATVARVTSLDADPGTATDTASPVALSTATGPTTKVYGNAITFDANGLPAATYGDTVTVKNGSTTLCSFTYSSSVSSCQASGMTTGSYSSVTEIFNGDSTYAAQTLSVPTFTIAKAPTTTTLAESVAAPVGGESETLTATVGGGSAGVPSGTVIFEDGGTAIAGCSAATVTNGVATCLTVLPIGNASLSAQYSGDSNFFSSSTTGSLTEASGTSSTTLAVAPSSPTSGASETLTATVGAVAPATATLTGTVEFTAGGNVIPGCAAVPLNGGIATCSTVLPVGSTDVAAIYSGDSNYTSSTAANNVTVAANETGAIATAIAETPLPLLISSMEPQILAANSVPVVATCDRASCIGTMNVTVARRVYDAHGTQIGWKHLVLAKQSFTLHAGQTVTLHLTDTPLGRVLLPRQTSWWLDRRPRFRMTLAAVLVGSPITHTQTFLKAKA